MIERPTPQPEETPGSPNRDHRGAEERPAFVAGSPAEEPVEFGRIGRGFGIGGHEVGTDGPGCSAFAADRAPHHWSVPWSDLMMVMFVVFAILVTTQFRRDIDAQATVPNEADREERARPAFDPFMTINVLERAQQALRETNMSNVDIMLMNDESVRVSVRGPMLFELGRADLRPQVERFLDRLALVIRQTPYRVEVVGHTDDFPVATTEFPSNWELSTARASRVARYLIESGRISPHRFTVSGHAEYRPAQPNSTEESRSQNRRVEILITREIIPGDETRTP